MLNPLLAGCCELAVSLGCPFLLWSQSPHVYGALLKTSLPSVEQVGEKNRQNAGEEKLLRKKIKLISHLWEGVLSSESFIIRL